MERYPKAFKHRVCGAYQKGKRGKGFGALSKRFGVAKSVIETWHEKWTLVVELLKLLKTMLVAIVEAY